MNSAKDVIDNRIRRFREGNISVVAAIPVGQDPIGVAFATVTPSHRAGER